MNSLHYSTFSGVKLAWNFSGFKRAAFLPMPTTNVVLDLAQLGSAIAQIRSREK